MIFTEEKNTRYHTKIPTKMAIIKKKKKNKLTTGDKDVGKLELLCTTGGNITWCSHYEMASPHKIKNINYYMIQQFHFRYIPGFEIGLGLGLE